MVATFDTLQVVKRLKEAGFDESQAEAVTGVFRELRDTDYSQLATKDGLDLLRSDVERLETSLRADMGHLESKMSMTIDIKITEAKAEIIRWVFGIAFAQAALILTVLKLFPGGHP
ncbi:MAG TPA: hypothetical protein VHW66_23715 [Stellaceae bacterium]|jgi:hypothetical protein|nr:hypothetical protein [Stellaceae bacterium]